MSDHLPMFTLLLDQSKNLNETSWLSLRDKSANNFATFTSRLANVNRLINFLNKYDILSRNQYGFRKIILPHML